MLKTTTSTDMTTDSHSVEHAANAFAGILAGETENRKDGKAQPVEGEELETEQVNDEEELDDEQPDGEADEDETDEDTDPESDEESDEEDEPRRKTYTVKVNGAEVEVDEDELLKGYSRTQDYTRKTQELAEQRKAAEAELNQVRAERQQYAQVLGALQQQIMQGMEAQPDWQALRDTDPIEYAAKWAEHQQRQQQLGAIQAERQRLAQQQQHEQAIRLQQVLKQERELTAKAIPEWSNPEVAKREKAELVDFGKKLGFSAEELGEITDHRAVVALRKAYLYDKLVAKKGEAQTKVRTGPVLKPGSANNVPPARTKLTKAKQRLAQTGRVEDAAAAFETILSGKR